MRNIVEAFTEIQLNYISLWVCIYGYPKGIEVNCWGIDWHLRKTNWEAMIDFSTKSEIVYGLYVKKREQMLSKEINLKFSTDVLICRFKY